VLVPSLALAFFAWTDWLVVEAHPARARAKIATASADTMRGRFREVVCVFMVRAGVCDKELKINESRGHPQRGHRGKTGNCAKRGFFNRSFKAKHGCFIGAPAIPNAGPGNRAASRVESKRRPEPARTGRRIKGASPVFCAVSYILQLSKHRPHSSKSR
jgi:hypothetical protein